jgi:predicted GNAT superfamily acetyltransferase
MIEFTTSQTDDDLLQILALQKANLPKNLTPGQMASQCFVTVNHSFETLQKMNATEQSIIARANGQVIGYLLAMTSAAKDDIPVLVPMFHAFDNILYRQKKISEYRYLVVGQVCIDEAWRGQGILDSCYAAYKEHFKSKYDFAITEISLKNARSINAHRRIGFSTVHIYTDPEGHEWDVVVWDWQNDSSV